MCTMPFIFPIETGEHNAAASKEELDMIRNLPVWDLHGAKDLFYRVLLPLACTCAHKGWIIEQRIPGMERMKETGN